MHPILGLMKNLIPAMFAVAVVSLPLGALASEPNASMPGPGMGGMMAQKLGLTPAQMQAMDQIMQQTGQQMEQLHAQARLKVLNAISPAHRQLLAQVIGNLAISPNPDRQAAVRQLNAALSPSEAQAVLSVHAATEQQMHQIMENTHQRMQALLTSQQRSEMPNGPHGPMGGRDMMYMRELPEGQLTAGDVLLHLGSGDTGMGDRMFIRQEIHN